MQWITNEKALSTSLILQRLTPPVPRRLPPTLSLPTPRRHNPYALSPYSPNSAISLLELSACGRGTIYDCRLRIFRLGRSDAGLVMKRHFIQSLCLTLLLIPTAVLADYQYQIDIGYRALENEYQLVSRGANL